MQRKEERRNENHLIFNKKQEFYPINNNNKHAITTSTNRANVPLNLFPDVAVMQFQYK